MTLLFNEPPLVVSPSLAKAIGLNEAIVLQQIHYWVESSRKAKRNYHEGRHWAYNTVAKWQEQFPFWSESTVKRILLSLRRSGLALAKNFNPAATDRTLWYSIDYEVLENKLSDLSESENAMGQIDPTEKGRLTPPKSPNCPDLYKGTETTSETTSSSGSEKDEKPLDPFWKGAARQVAREVIREQKGSAAVPDFMKDAPWGNLAQELGLPPAIVFSHFRTYLETLSNVTGKRDPIAYAGAILNDLYKYPGKELACKPWIDFQNHYRIHQVVPDVGFADTSLGQNYERFKSVLDQVED